MKPEDALRILRLVRFQPLKGRKVCMETIARLSGFDSVSLYRAIRRSWLSQRMVNRLEPILEQTKTVLEGHIASKNGPLGGRDARGGDRRPWGRARPAPARRAGTKRGPEDDIDGETSV